MPTYQYACTEAECGHLFEQFQDFSDDSLTVCPQCEGRLRKVFNAVGVVFKGSGFYRTDSRGNGKPEGAGSATAGQAGGESGATTSSSTGTDSSTSSSGSTTGGSSPGTAPGTSSSTSAPAGAGAA